MPRRTLYQSPKVQPDEWHRTWPSEPLSDEPPRAVYQNACAQIATAIAPLGFKYAKSKQECKRERLGFGNTISFQSSHSNVRGAHVQLWMHATVSSAVLQAWQAERLTVGMVRPVFAGGMVHLLGSRYAMLEWELADPGDRAATIADAVSFIHEEVIPYFALFERPTELIDYLQSKELPGLWLSESVDFAYCFGDKQKAQGVLNRFVRDHPEFDKPAERTEDMPLPGKIYRTGNYSKQIASLRSRYQLD